MSLLNILYEETVNGIAVNARAPCPGVFIIAPLHKSLTIFCCSIFCKELNLKSQSKDT